MINILQHFFDGQLSVDKLFEICPNFTKVNNSCAICLQLYFDNSSIFFECEKQMLLSSTKCDWVEIKISKRKFKEPDIHICIEIGHSCMCLSI